MLLVALCTRFITIDRPFQRDPEGCGSFYGTLARNYFRYGVTKTFAVPIQNAGIMPDAPVFYPNHPPLLPLLVAGTYAALRLESDERRRAAGLANAIVDDAGDLRVRRDDLRHAAQPRRIPRGDVRSDLFSLMPMTLVFGSQPDVINTQLDFFTLLTIAAYLRFHGSSKPVAVSAALPRVHSARGHRLAGILSGDRAGHSLHRHATAAAMAMDHRVWILRRGGVLPAVCASRRGHA